MCYATLDEVKLKIGIDPSDTSQDQRLQYYLDATCAAMNQVIGDLTKGTKTEDLSCCMIKCDSCCCNAYLDVRIRNVESLDTIDGNAVDPDDYKIV